MEILVGTLLQTCSSHFALFFLNFGCAFFLFVTKNHVSLIVLLATWIVLHLRKSPQNHMGD